MDQAVNVALVGFGYAGRVFHAPLIEAVSGLKLAGIVSSRPAAIDAAKPGTRVIPTLESALRDDGVDLVVIATPNALHASQAHAALSAGKHVVVDKPFTVTVAEAEAVCAQAERAGRVLSVFHNRRWDSDFLTLQALIGRDALGDVRYLESHFDRYRPQVRDRWRERRGSGAGLWFDLGPHLIDQVLQLFGPPDDISVDRAMLRDGAQVDDYFHATLSYAKRRVVLHASMLAPVHDVRFLVHGTRGSYVKEGLDTQESTLVAGRTPHDITWGQDPRPGLLTTVDDADRRSESVPNEPGDYCRFYAAVRDAIRDGAPNPVSSREALEVMRWLERGVPIADATVSPS
ncbi:MAG: oxidoreductase [Gemmatimonadaceae bacterium]